MGFVPIKPEQRPQDPGLHGAGWTFQTVEHGGSDPETMPQGIVATDAEGRWCVYVPLVVDGAIARPDLDRITTSSRAVRWSAE